MNYISQFSVDRHERLKSALKTSLVAAEARLATAREKIAEADAEYAAWKSRSLLYRIFNFSKRPMNIFYEELVWERSFAANDVRSIKYLSRRVEAAGTLSVELTEKETALMRFTEEA